MKTLFSTFALFFVCAGFVTGTGAEWLAQVQSSDDNAKQTDGKIRFTFADQDWQDVVPWFAEQAGYSLQPVSDWPEGTFSLKDDSEYTVLEALDQLNHALRIRKPEPYTLIRNRKMLILAKVADAEFHDDLFETVAVEDLDQRGKHETINCVFDLGELNAEEMYSQIEPTINPAYKDAFYLFKSTNQIKVRESGGRLRDIRDLINDARPDVRVYRMKHLDPETFLQISRNLLGMDAESNARKDGALTITVEPLGDRLFVHGTKKMLGLFDRTAQTVDVASDAVGGEIVIDSFDMQFYPVVSDPKLAFDLLQTVLEGRDGVKMQQDELTGGIYLLGRSKDHELATEALTKLSNQADGFDIIPLEKADPAEIIVTLQNLFGQTAENSSGPVLLANAERKHIIVRGTPQEVAAVRQMVAKLDESAVAISVGPRSQRRLIPLDQRDQDKVQPMIEDLLRTRGRTNRVNIVMPKNRAAGRDRSRVPSKRDRQSPPPPTPIGFRGLKLDRAISDAAVLFAYRFSGSHAAVSLLTPVQAQDNDKSNSTNQRGAYRPAPELPSVDGAPIRVEFTEYGIVLSSEDLDALDDLEDLINGQIDQSSSVQAPTFFYLDHRSAEQMFEFLEEYYDLSSSGGDGGGGLVSGLVDNVIGGGGDLLDGILGGGGSSGSGGVLEGDVKMGFDLQSNFLWVRGATSNDLDDIEFIIDTLDQPEAPNDPRLVGEFRTIDIIHRDPMEVKELVEQQLASLIDTGEKSEENGQGGRNNQAAQIARTLQQLGGGRQGGAKSKKREQEKPKVRLGVDLATKRLLVTGPEFIYDQIQAMVIALDKEELSNTPAIEIMPKVGNIDLVKPALKAMLADKIEFVTETQENQANPAQAGNNQRNNTRNNARQRNNNGANNAAATQQAIRQQFFRSLQRQQAGGNNRRNNAPGRTNNRAPGRGGR